MADDVMGKAAADTKPVSENAMVRVCEPPDICTLTVFRSINGSPPVRIGLDSPVLTLTMKSPRLWLTVTAPVFEFVSHAAPSAQLSVAPPSMEYWSVGTACAAGSVPSRSAAVAA